MIQHLFITLLLLYSLEHSFLQAQQATVVPEKPDLLYHERLSDNEAIVDKENRPGRFFEKKDEEPDLECHENLSDDENIEDKENRPGHFVEKQDEPLTKKVITQPQSGWLSGCEQSQGLPVKLT